MWFSTHVHTAHYQTGTTAEHIRAYSLEHLKNTSAVTVLRDVETISIATCSTGLILKLLSIYTGIKYIFQSAVFTLASQQGRLPPWVVNVFQTS